MNALAAGFFSQVEVVGAGRRGTSGQRHVDGAAEGVRVEPRHERHGRVLRSRVTVTAEDDVVLEHVSSFAMTGVAAALGAAEDWEHRIELWSARNPWSGEHRWSGRALGDLGLVDVGMTRFGQTGTKNRVALTSAGSWPSAELLPMGWLTGPGGTLAWQIEHNGSWHAEIGDRHGELYLSLSGPSHREHGWSVRLAPGESFTSVPVAVVLIEGGFDDAVAELTAYRRALRRPHRDNAELPVVFNDFMNCLMGDPTTERLLPLVRAAGEAGAEYFVIDAGWFDDERGPDGVGGVPSWWDAVGEWLPAASRFPGGLAEVTDAIKAAGMVPGLWLEPEVVGVRAAERLGLPDDAYFRRGGVRVAEWGRYQLDLRRPAAVAHLDAAVDRLVTEYGLGYLKFDYNIDIGTGSEDGGHGLLGHNRAWPAWVERVLDRHPDLVIEACAAGGMRADGATLAAHPITSLTDQQDATFLPPIAAAAPAAVPPEQGAMWACPQGSDDAVTLAMVTAMLGRIHLSGRLDQLDASQLAQVAEALAVYRSYRGDLARGIPRWPLGLPRWDADRTALAIDCGDVVYLAVWRRGGSEPLLDVPWPEAVHVDPLFPADARADWDAGAVRARLAGPHTACLLCLRPLRSAPGQEGSTCREE